MKEVICTVEIILCFAAMIELLIIGYKVIKDD